jgi:hypothetical protein
MSVVFSSCAIFAEHVAAVRSASAARSAFPASTIAAANFERSAIRETAMLAEFAKSVVAAQSSTRIASTVFLFGIFRTFYSDTRKTLMRTAALQMV